MANEDEQASTSPDADATGEITRGPHGWLNWRAKELGNPRRKESHPDNMVIDPIWEEFALYTDAPLEGGGIGFGPFELIDIDRVSASSAGNSRKALLLRSWDHLVDEPMTPGSGLALESDSGDYFGGDMGDEIAALLGLALGCRLHSGGPVRKGIPNENFPLGLANETEHHAPFLSPPHRDPMIPGIANSQKLADAKELLNLYPKLSGGDAVALVRASRQYGDALWYADADPRLAWIKLVGALEVAANRRDDVRHEDPVKQLKKRNRTLLRKPFTPFPSRNQIAFFCQDV